MLAYATEVIIHLLDDLPALERAGAKADSRRPPDQDIDTREAQAPLLILFERWDR